VAKNQFLDPKELKAAEQERVFIIVNTNYAYSLQRYVNRVVNRYRRGKTSGSDNTVCEDGCLPLSRLCYIISKPLRNEIRPRNVSI
jgi:hypothetical protein